MFCLTFVGVGVEGESAILDIKGEGVDVQVAGAQHSERHVVVDHAIRLDMQIRHKWGCVLIHTVRKQQEHFPTMLEKTARFRCVREKTYLSTLGLIHTFT